jgi:colanic acid biosynthesis glycosyl transferase WcaI
LASKVILLTQWFDPEPTFKGLVFAKELVRLGFDVEVITGFPNYPGGKIYPGYRIKLVQREVINGVRVTRLPLYPSHDQSAIKRVLNYASFGASALVYGLFHVKRVDVIYAYHPPLSVGMAASLIKTLRGSKVVYDIQDMWPDTLHATGMLNNPRALNLIGKVCDWVYRRVDEIVVLSPGFKKLLIERGVPEQKISVIYNWADEESLKGYSGSLPEPFLDKSSFKIVFAGNMGKAQALESVLSAAQLLQQQGSRVQFLMVGGGVEVPRLKRLATEQGLKNIKFLPPVPMVEIGLYLGAADALLVHLRSDPLFQITIPSKTQAYMCVGKPLLMAVDGDAADLVRRSGGGVVAESENPVGLAQAADQLADMPLVSLDEMGRMAKSFYAQTLALPVGAAKFADIIRRFQ